MVRGHECLEAWGIGFGVLEQQHQDRVAHFVWGVEEFSHLVLGELGQVRPVVVVRAFVDLRSGRCWAGERVHDVCVNIPFEICHGYTMEIYIGPLVVENPLFALPVLIEIGRTGVMFIMQSFKFRITL